ncbi:type VI secretion system baseplate subunit TssG [Bartonella sp. HY329]|uniref:type VI secretion system baseplate subunit TssG n=1 Tax=unclassified Bartonella TaxID=2645622 RepID=UPI0021CA876B|nr:MULTISPECIES: type VI secretion system baseplate subunit TssG [unclassified Bartonella]UXM95235.1 type VI secretion system baseplate subunit TssG [Bartonella sp. HY329]UXN09559.1 type VI secretion system baseplate subunit TssG [Bartonella sp. HY328]
MASEDRTTAADLSGFLFKNSREFSAFEAIELIEKIIDKGVEVGTHQLAFDEKILFEVDSSLGFPTSDIVRIKQIDESSHSERYKIKVTFMGLHGSSTVLPSYYAEQIAHYEQDQSVTKDFFDFFHNRIIGLLYRAWRQPRYFRRYQPGGEDKFSTWIFSMFGLGNTESRKFTNIYWPRLLCFAGLLSTRNRSPALFSTVISRAFNLEKVKIEEWIPRKVKIASEQLTKLGQKNSQLGQNMILGEFAPDIQGKIRIVIQDLDFRRFQDFLPHGKDFNGLRGLVEFMFRDQLSYDLKLGLKKQEAYPITLAKDSPSRLGWSSFLGDGKFDEVRDVIIKVRS